MISVSVGSDVGSCVRPCETAADDFEHASWRNSSQTSCISRCNPR